MLASCRPTKHLAEDEFLLVENRITVDDQDVNKEDLGGIVKQKPNRSVFGIIRPYLTVYNYASRRKQNWLNRWLVRIGEPPVIADHVLTEKSRKQLEQYMKNKGYFNATVSDSVSYRKRNPKKAVVHYQITARQPYTIRKFPYSVLDPDLTKDFLRAAAKGGIKPGENFDVEKLDAVRGRLTADMRNMGYYYFNKQYVHFEVDSNLKSHQVDLNVIVRNPTTVEQLEDGRDTLMEGKHRIYYIDEVFIRTDFDQKTFNPALEDTVAVGDFHFISSSTPRFRPDVLLKHMFIKKGEMYRLVNHQLTTQRLGELRTFKFISIRYQDLGDQKLRCTVNLTPTARQSLTLETEGTNQQGNLGIQGAVIYNNRNTFKGAERLEFKVTGGLEAQQIATEESVEVQSTEGDGTVERTVEELTPFNTIEIGGETSLVIPELFLNRLFANSINYQKPKTRITAAYNFQNRPDFTRTVASANYGYEWRKGDFNLLQLYLIDIAFIDINTEPDFAERLAQLNNRVLTSSYEDRFIPSSRFVYTFYNAESSKPRKKTWFIKPRIELAGNLMRAGYSLAGAEKDENGSYRINNTAFAQYIKTDLEVRRSIPLTRHTQMVYRGFSGIGVPLDNVEALPFEKSFFGGGANAIRAWRARSLGPGSLPDTLRTGVDKIGEIHLEGNMEYRFDIISILDGAAFVDVGNIWTLTPHDGQPGTDFQTDRFFEEIAVGAGLGARLDFTLFVLRVDLAAQIKDPAMPKGERWVFQPKDKLNEMRESLGYQRYRLPPTVVNLAIGYPF